MSRKAILASAALLVLSLVLPVTAKDSVPDPAHAPDAAYVGPSWPDGAALAMVDWDDMSATLTWPAALAGDAPLSVYVISRNGVPQGGWPAAGPRSVTFNHAPDTVYQYTVVARDENLVSSEPLVLNFSTGTGIFWPFDAQGVSVPLSNTSTRMEWSQALHTDGEIVSYRIAFNDLGQVFAEVDASTLSYTFDGLTLGEHYFVGITAVDAEGLTSSQLVRPFFQVSPPHWPPGAMLSATAIDSYFVQLEWPHATDDFHEVQSYSIRRDGVQIDLIPSSTNSYLDSGLSADTDYFYEVVAFDENTVASVPLSASVTTGVGPYWHSLVGLHLVTRNSSSTEVYWPEARSQDAEVILYRIDLDGEVVAVVPSYIQYLVIEGLQAGTTHLVETWALDDSGLWSRPLAAEFTQMPGNGPVWPSGAKLSASTGGEGVTLAWPAAIAGDGPVAHYEVYVDGLFLTGVPASQRTIVLSGLESGEEYNFAVRAMDSWNLTSSFLEVTATIYDVSIGAFDPSTGRWHLRAPDGAVRTFYFGNPGDIPFVGDWDGDGMATPGLYRQSTGFGYLINSIPPEGSARSADLTFFFGSPGDVPIVGDWDGDGKDTLSIYRQSEGRVYIINRLPNQGGSPVADFSYYFGTPGDKPFAGDFDGDDKDTVGLHRESTGIVYFRNSHTTGVANNEFYFGIPGDRLIAGDWGIVNGIDTPGVFRPSNMTWYFRFTNSQGFAEHQFTWGQSHWLPVAGDWGFAN